MQVKRMERISITEKWSLLPKFNNFIGKITKFMDDLEKLPQASFYSSLLLSSVGSSVSNSRSW